MKEIRAYIDIIMSRWIRNTLALMSASFILMGVSAFTHPPRRNGLTTSPRTFELFVGSKDHFDMEELRQRIQQDTNPYRDLFASSSAMNSRERPTQVYVILFQPETVEEGVHTIEYPKGSGSNVILAFSSLDECAKFAAALKEQEFFDPTPQEFLLDALEVSCEALGVFVQVVPKGMDLLPPRETAKVLGAHNPFLRGAQHNLDYVFEMANAELEEAGVLVTEAVGSWD